MRRSNSVGATEPRRTDLARFFAAIFIARIPGSGFVPDDAFYYLEIAGARPITVTSVAGRTAVRLTSDVNVTIGLALFAFLMFHVEGVRALGVRGYLGKFFSLRAFRDDILPRLGDPGLALVDVRSPAEYNGEIIAPPGMSETAQRAGHIPGAASIPWAQTVLEDGTFKSAEELATLYEAKGITPDKDVIAYCRIGERSSHTWFVLKYLLGYDRVRNYDGSWTEWGSMIGTPIER